MGIWVKGKLLEHKWFKDSCITKAHPSMGTAHKRWKFGSHCTVPGSSTGWAMSVSGISGGLILFQAAWLF